MKAKKFKEAVGSFKQALDKMVRFENWYDLDSLEIGDQWSGINSLTCI